MASNHTQYNRNKHDRDDRNDISTDLNQLSSSSITNDTTLNGQTVRSDTQNDINSVATSNDGNRFSNNKPSYQASPSMFTERNMTNDPLVLRHRRTGLYNQKFKNLELMGEDKVAKNKLDLLHWSVPSSLKSTFMMAFSPNGQRVASTHGDHRIYICDLNTGQHLETLEGHPKTPWCFAWHPSNKDILASGCLSGEVRVWDLRSKDCELWTSENNTIITSISFHPKQRILAIATANAIHFWDWCENAPFAVSTSPYDKERVKYVEFDSSGSKLITGITNCAAITAFSRDSLQNRIIDSYINNGNNHQTQSDNMTQNSEISFQQHHNHHQLNSNPSINSNINPVDVTRSSASTTVVNRQDQAPVQARKCHCPNIESNNMSSTITMTLSRIACLYKNLESLEDSIRNKSFPAYNSTHQRQTLEPQNVLSSNNDANDALNRTSNSMNQTERKLDQSEHEMSTSHGQSTTTNRSDPIIQQQAKTNDPKAQERSQVSDNPSIRSPNAYEPLVVLFDELLENIQLSPIIVRGRTVDITSVLARNPIDLSNHLDYVVQFESINQVNQNFIRISKLMSSVRLYRQIIQQILSNNSGQGHYQPNQFLTAQSTVHPSHANGANIPIVFRYGALPGAMGLADEHNGSPDRPIDPIMAIQFRNCARNVPLGSVCKVDLLCARSMCMVRSQQYLETSTGLPGARYKSDSTNILNESLARILDNEIESREQQQTSASRVGDANDGTQIIESFHPLLGHLYSCLSNINQTPLTTSNVHTQIATLRNILARLLTKFQSMIQKQEDSSRLIKLIHEISQNLTGRSWNTPLGRTFDELRLDVIHTFCMVDLTLQLARQIQLLQMQRISAIARIKDRRSNNSTQNREQVSGPLPCSSSSTSINLTSSSSNSTTLIKQQNQSQQPNKSINDDSSIDNNVTENPPGKRRNNDKSSPSHSAHKKTKIDPNSGTEMIESSQQQQQHANNPVINDGLVISSPPKNASVNNYNNINNNDTSNHNQQLHNSPQSMENLTGTSSSALDASMNLLDDTMNVVNIERPNLPGTAQQTSPASLQRVYLASTPTNNLQIFMRIIQRVQNSNGSGGALPNSDELSADRAFNSIPPPLEVRRRALSHDNSHIIPTSNPPNETMIRSYLADGMSGVQNMNTHNRTRLVTASPSNSSVNLGSASNVDIWPRHQFHIFIPNHPHRGANVLYWTLPAASSNYRLQCWDFSTSSIPNIKDAITNVVANRCRIDTNASVDISKDGNLIACLVPQEDAGHHVINRYELRVISLKASDFGTCHYALPQGPQAISVSFSPSARYVVVGLTVLRQSFLGNQNPDDPDSLPIAKVFRLNEKFSFGHIRDINIKRQGSMNLNAIKWMPRGIVYNVGQHHMHHHRYQTRRFNHA